jgi:hypothetical protein
LRGQPSRGSYRKVWSPICRLPPSPWDFRKEIGGGGGNSFNKLNVYTSSNRQPLNYSKRNHQITSASHRELPSRPRYSNETTAGHRTSNNNTNIINIPPLKLHRKAITTLITHARTTPPFPFVETTSRHGKRDCWALSTRRQAEESFGNAGTSNCCDEVSGEKRGYRGSYS